MVTTKYEGNVLFCCTHILLLNYIPSLFYCFCKNNSTGGTWPPRITCKTGQLPLQWDLVIALLSRKSLSGFFFKLVEKQIFNLNDVFCPEMVIRSWFTALRGQTALCSSALWLSSSWTHAAAHWRASWLC